MVSEAKSPSDSRPVEKLSPKQPGANERLSSRATRAIQEKQPPAQEGSGEQYLRQKAVGKAWEQEQQLVRLTNKGTREWAPNQLRTLQEGNKVPGYEGHHIRSVNKHTEKWTGDPRNIAFGTRKEHFNLHQRDFHNPTTGTLIDRPSMIRMAEANRQVVRPRPTKEE
jgi:hypothetical protein